MVVRVAAAVAALVVLYGAFTGVQVWWASNTDSSPPSDAIVVLGAAQYNGRPSPVLEARLAHALDLYRRGLAPRVVVTGGRRTGDRFTESTTGYNWLRARGVPDGAILKEVQGRNTSQTLAAVARILHGRGVDEVILVSDATYSLRLEGVAREVGLRPHVSPERAIQRSLLGRARDLARETVAVAAGRIVGYRRLTRMVG